MELNNYYIEFFNIFDFYITQINNNVLTLIYNFLFNIESQRLLLGFNTFNIVLNFYDNSFFLLFINYIIILLLLLIYKNTILKVILF